MKDIFATLLATDALSQRYGSGLNPKLRDAIAAELRFPAKSSGPDGRAAANDPDVILLRQPEASKKHRKA